MTHAAKMLSLIESQLEGRAVDGVDQYQIAGRSITKIPIVELVKLRDYYKGKVDAESGLATRTVKFNFTTP